MRDIVLPEGDACLYFRGAFAIPAEFQAGETTQLHTDVVIVAHNPGGLLSEAVTSAAEQAGAGHVWVMDAESTDGSVDRLREGSAQSASPLAGIHIVPVPNAGFSASNNRGIEASVAPLVLLLNPDAALCEGALQALEAAADANPRAGIIGALVLNVDRSIQANSFGRFPSLAGLVSLRLWRIGQRLRGNTRLSPKVPASTARTDWVTGAAMLARREAIDDVGAMDEAFFLYYEDLEWCHRMRDRGWEVLLEPKAQAIHHLGGAGAAGTVVTRAYRASFYRYCDIHGLWGLKAVSHAGLWLRRLLGGAS